MAARVQVEIDVDTKKFEGGLDKAAGLIRSFLTLGAMAGAARAAIELGSRITDLSNKAQVSAQWLQEVGYAAQMAGSSMDAVANAILDLTRAQAQAMAGGEGDLGAFASLGVSLDDLRKLRPEELFDRVAASLEAGAGDAAKMNAALQVMGRGGRELIGGLTDGFSEARAAARDLGLVLDDETVAAMDDLGDRLDTLKLGFTALTSVILKNMMSLNNWASLARLAMALVGPGSKFGPASMTAAYLKGGLSGVAGNMLVGAADLADIVGDYEVGEAENAETARQKRERRRGQRTPGAARGGGGSVTSDALQRIGLYVGGGGAFGASLLNTQRQALTVLRQIDAKLRTSQGRTPGRFDQ